MAPKHTLRARLLFIAPSLLVLLACVAFAFPRPQATLAQTGMEGTPQVWLPVVEGGFRADHATGTPTASGTPTTSLSTSTHTPATATPEPSDTGSPSTPTPASTGTPTATATEIATETDTETPTAVPTDTPTDTPTNTPTQTPTSTPWATPRAGNTRETASSLYQEAYLAPFSVDPGYTGSVATCLAGDISPARAQALLKQINYFRVMAGVAPVTLDAVMNGYSQAATLIMAANETLTHSPGASLRCYSEAGAIGAGSSNLSRVMIGSSGDWPAFPHSWAGVIGQMEDDGANNLPVGHRDWLLDPLLWRVGVGESIHHFTSLYSFPGEAPITMYNLDYYNAIYVVDPAVNFYAPWPTRPGHLTWPPSGWVPYQVAYYRWSLHVALGQTVENATVEMWLNGVPVGLTIVYQPIGGSTLVWEPDSSIAADWGSPSFVTVRVSNLGPAEAPLPAYTYDVLLFDASLPANAASAAQHAAPATLWRELDRNN